MIRQDGSSMDKVIESPRRWHWIIYFLLLLLLFISFFYLFYPSISSWFSAERSIELSRIRTGTATRGELVRDVSVQGSIIASDHPTVVSPAQGVISILVKAGDVVFQGAKLATIESPAMLNQLEQEKSILLSMNSELEKLKLTSRQSEYQDQQEVALLEVRLRADERARERARKLFGEGLTSSIDYEKARDDAEVARLELNQAIENARMAKEAAEFEIRSTGLKLDRQELIVSDLQRKITELSIESPVSGLVSRVEVRDKDTVQPAQQLFSIVNLEEFEIEIRIPENYADDVVPGTQAVIRYEGDEYPGEVKSLSPEVELSQVKGIVSFGVSAPSGIKQNQRVYTRLILDSHSDIIKIPRGPFLESMGGRKVYVINGDVAQLKAIRTGAVSVTEVEILSGLKVGDEVILSDLARYDGVETILLRR